MTNPIVKVIEPTKRQTATLRVAAYCRVSSDSTDQLHSYATQIKAYTEEIATQPHWELVDVYADEGLTGTKLEGREEFQRMMSDCRKGKIDRILVKSLSRFSRNTKDCLAALRELSGLGVTVKFEKENIDTGTLTTELMVSVSSALAQQESVSISQNQRQSYKRRMERGEFITCAAPYGYQLQQGRLLVIDEYEAQQVKYIFDLYLKGESLPRIAKLLTSQNIPAPNGKKTWGVTPLRYIIKNEKYTGNTLAQKTFTTIAFPFTRKRNHGEVDQYFTENSHPAIITNDTYQRARALVSQRSGNEGAEQKAYHLTKKIKCAHCDTWFSRRSSVNGYTTWVCRIHDQKADACPTGRTPEPDIYNSFIMLYNKIKAQMDTLFTPAINQLEELQIALNKRNPKLVEINMSIAQMNEQIHKINKLQTAGLLDDSVALTKRISLQAELTTLRKTRRGVLENADIDERLELIHRTVSVLNAGPARLETFDEIIFRDLVDRITIDQYGNMNFTLYGGIVLNKERSI